MKKAIIIGSSSGIGMQLAKIMSKDGIILGLTGRRIELLDNLKNQLSAPVYTKYMDIMNTNESIDCLNGLIEDMGGVDLIIVSAGTGYINKNLEWKLEQETINTNVLGVTAIIDTSIKYFISKKSGHLAAISSIASLRGSADCPAYNASKAYLSNYLEGIRCKIKKQNLDIVITDIKPGLVDTAMAKGDGLFWVMPLEKVTTQIYTALKKRKDQIYVTKRWGVLGFILKRIPNYLYYKM
jgi:Short-chain dehydrogenases of various substrate specificities